MARSRPQVTILSRHGLTPLGRWAIPTIFEAQVYDPASPVNIVIEVRTRAGRPPEITDLRLTWHDLRRPTGITPAELRRVRLGGALQLALAAVREEREDRDDGLFRVAGTEDGVYYAGPQPAPARGKPVSDDRLREVARLYRELVATGSRKPTQDIADQYHWSRSTVGRWLVEARRKGFLGPAVGTKAGVAPRKKGTN